MTRLSWLILVVTIQLTIADDCDLCHKMAQYVLSFKGQAYADVKAKAISSIRTFPTSDQPFLNNLISYNFRKLYMDVNSAASGMTPSTSCSDMGFCDTKDEFKAPFTIVDYKASFWDDHSAVKNTRDKTIIVVHHTVDPTLPDTILSLKNAGLSVQYIVDRDGKIYRLVDDYRRAYHAGAGIWRGDGCTVDDTNTRSVGIETVNTGGEPYPDVQVKALHQLISYLRTKWHVEPQNIIAHHENSPWQKYDISGYFSWKSLYDEFKENVGLWKSNLTAAQQKEVVLSDKVKNATLLKEVQQKLYEYGHGYIVVGDPYSTSATSKVTTALAIQAFNRKFCPEVFILESVKNGNEVTHAENLQTYKLTVERLNWLHAHTKLPNCTNY
ncbi:unnamed protein product, partial [Mesorhabditis belari]|uniref:N-acetylmuramoyl-L-alanine amidase n=1 Tax=Mesorhabditis belari TaxID=2138241 RepID=A0AAF3ECF7_9BILA